MQNRPTTGTAHGGTSFSLTASGSVPPQYTPARVLKQIKAKQQQRNRFLFHKAESEALSWMQLVKALDFNGFFLIGGSNMTEVGLLREQS